MIRNIEFKDSDKYLESTIDGMTVPLKLEEIKKKEVIIDNQGFTSIPLYEKIPINLLFYTADDLPIDKGEIDISIISKNENGNIIQNYYNNTVIFNNNMYQDDIKVDIPLGIYYVIIKYKGNKYYQASTLTYKLTIEPRKILYDFESSEYYGNPSEVIDVKFKIYDSITKQAASNFIIYYEYEENTYVTKSDQYGYVRFQATIPEPRTLCINNNNRIYPINMYIDNDAYYASNATIYMRNNKMQTSINFNSNLSENGVNIFGNVIANNYENIVNVMNGNVVLTIENEEYETFELKPINEGNFDFHISMKNIHYNFENEESDYIQRYDKPVDVYIGLSNISDVSINTEINPIATVKDRYDIPVKYGMITFSLIKNDEILEDKIVEVNDDGSAITNFYISTKGNYTMQCKYHPMFEYKNLQDYYTLDFKVE